MKSAEVQQKVFKENPTFRRGIVVAWNMDNHGLVPELEELLKEAVQKAAENPLDLKEDARINPWLEAHRKFNSNPNKFPPAHCSLLKRVQKPGVSIPYINKTVAIMNYCSITGINPVGGDDLDSAGTRLVLKYAEGGERFVPLDTPESIEHPEKGEIIYLSEDSGEVMCRRWNWRNGFKTRITEDTKGIVMNIDGIGKGNIKNTLSVRDKVAELLEKYCRAKVLVTLLSPEQNSFSFDI